MPRGREVSEQERLRRRLGLSVTAFAKTVGFSHSYVSQVEGGVLRPSLRYRSAAALALGIPESVIFPEESRPE